MKNSKHIKQPSADKKAIAQAKRLAKRYTDSINQLQALKNIIYTGSKTPGAFDHHLIDETVMCAKLVFVSIPCRENIPSRDEASEMTRAIALIEHLDIAEITLRQWLMEIREDVTTG